MSQTSDIKSALRVEMRRLLKAIPEAERVRASASARDRLKSHPTWERACAILFYAPLDSEPNLAPLWKEAHDTGKTVALPRYVPSEGGYRAGQLLHPGQSLVRGQFGIPEPSADGPLVPLNQLDLVLVPGLAFDMTGRRLGRGRGFYDRLLTEIHGTKCGVAFDLQIRENLPVEAHDVVLNCLLTPTRWLSFGLSAALK